MKISNNQFERRIFNKFHGYIKPLSIYKNANTKIKFQCVKGHVFRASPTAVYDHRYTGCSICNSQLHLIGGSKKMGRHQFNLRLQKVAHGKVKIIGKYHGSNLPLKLQCLKGHVFERKPSDIIRYDLWKCPTCKYNKKRLSFVKCLRSDHYKLLGHFKNKSTKVLIECSRGHKYMTTPVNFLRGSRCNKCKGVEHSKYIRANPESRYNYFLRKFKTKIGNQYYLLSDYISSRVDIVIKHKTCGYKWTTTPSRFLRSKAPCPRCNPQNHSEVFNTAYMANRINRITSGEYTLVGKYYGGKRKALIRHNKCGHVFKMTPNNFINEGNRCVFCCQRSKGETKIKNYLKHRHLRFNHGYITNIKYKRYLHFDFWNLDHLIAIEYDGIQHFKPVDFSGEKTWKQTVKDFHILKRRDAQKDIYCALHGIKLIRIPYWEYKNIKNILDSKFQDELIVS